MTFDWWGYDTLLFDDGRRLLADDAWNTELEVAGGQYFEAGRVDIYINESHPWGLRSTSLLVSR